MKDKLVQIWTSIAVRKDTHRILEGMKEIKAPGKLENFDDVIRRSIEAPPIEEDSE